MLIGILLPYKPFEALTIYHVLSLFAYHLSVLHVMTRHNQCSITTYIS